MVYTVELTEKKTFCHCSMMHTSVDSHITASKKEQSNISVTITVTQVILFFSHYVTKAISAVMLSASHKLKEYLNRRAADRTLASSRLPCQKCNAAILL